MLTLKEMVMIFLAGITLLFIACDDNNDNKSKAEAEDTDSKDDPKDLDKDSSSETAKDSETDSQADIEDEKKPKYAVVITTDYSTGAISTIELSELSVEAAAMVVHSDTVCRYDEKTHKVYLISRLGADSITVLDPDNNFSVVKQYSVEAGTNAQDIAVFNDQRAYVPRLGSSDLLVVNPITGAEIEKIDLSEFADSDGNPEATQALVADDFLFVTLQRMDEFWSIEDYSSILILDAKNGEIKEELILSATNPTGILRYNKILDGLLVVEAGAYGVLDGGLELIYTDGASDGLIITEEELGGDLIDAIVVSETLGYAVISKFVDDKTITMFVTFNPIGGKLEETLLTSEGYHLGFLSTPDYKTIWVTDANPTNPGIRLFDSLTGEELLDETLDVGLPPTMICFSN